MGTSTKYEIDGKEFTPTDLSSFVLKKLHEDAQKELGKFLFSCRFRRSLVQV